MWWREFIRGLLRIIYFLTARYRGTEGAGSDVGKCNGFLLAEAVNFHLLNGRAELSRDPHNAFKRRDEIELKASWATRYLTDRYLEK